MPEQTFNCFIWNDAKASQFCKSPKKHVKSVARLILLIIGLWRLVRVLEAVFRHYWTYYKCFELYWGWKLL